MEKRIVSPLIAFFVCDILDFFFHWYNATNCFQVLHINIDIDRMFLLMHTQLSLDIGQDLLQHILAATDCLQFVLEKLQRI